jgi:hypothetical protein
MRLYRLQPESFADGSQSLSLRIGEAGSLWQIGTWNLALCSNCRGPAAYPCFEALRDESIDREWSGAADNEGCETGYIEQYAS